jgi:hypothetical protein
MSLNSHPNVLGGGFPSTAGSGGSGPYGPSSFTSNKVLWGNGAGNILTAAPGGSSITDDGSGALAIAASGTNQNITLTPSGTGVVSLSGSGASPGLLRFPAGAADATSGIGFGTDTSFYRAAPAQLYINNNGGTGDATIALADGSVRAAFQYLHGTGTATLASLNGSLVLKSNNTTAITLDSSQNAFFSTGSNGQSLNIKHLTELTTIAAAGTTTTTIQMPAGAIVLSVSVRVTTVIPTATSFSVGDAGSATRFSTANVSTAATSTDVGTKAGAYYNASATGILLTMNGGTPADNTGRVRVTIAYIDVTVPTS